MALKEVPVREARYNRSRYAVIRPSAKDFKFALMGET